MEEKDLPKGWKLIDFTKSCQVISLNGIKIKQKEYLENGKYPVVDQGQELIGGYSNSKELLIEEEPPYIVFGDHTKIKKYINFKFVAGADGIKVLKPYEFYNPKLFYYFLFCIKIPDKGYARHFQFYKNSTIPLPPINEQEKLVSKIEELFSELDNGIEQLKTAKEQLKVYRQSVLKWAFEGKLTNKNIKDGELPKGWKVVKIGDYAKSIVPNRDKPKSFSGNIPWVTTPDLNDNSISIDYSKIEQGLTLQEVELYKAKIIPVNSVIMICVGKFGVSAVVKNALVINQQLHAFLPTKEFTPKYIAYNIQNQKLYFESKSTSTTIAYLNKENCNSMPVPYCDIEEQLEIVQEIELRLSVCDKVEETIETAMKQSESLQQSILKKAFEGKLI